jgi:hypothetical protein
VIGGFHPSPKEKQGTRRSQRAHKKGNPKREGDVFPKSMLVLMNAIAWLLSLVCLPYGIAALTIGRFGDVAALVVFFIGVVAMWRWIEPPKPLGAEPSDAPHLTLFHPHGILCVGNMVFASGDRWNASRRRMHGPPHFIAANVTVLADFWARLHSCRCSSPSRASMVSLMRQRRDIMVYPGGLVEAARHDHRKDVVDVGSRGAIRLALEHGYAVRVAFSFGERHTAYNLNLECLWRVRFWLARRGIPSVVPLMRLWARAPRLAFSPTIQFPAVSEPTDEDVERWHAEYVAALRALHARYKAPDDELVVHDSRAPTTRPEETSAEPPLFFCRGSKTG